MRFTNVTIIEVLNPINQEAAKRVQEAEGIKDSHDRRSVPRFDVLSGGFDIFNGRGIKTTNQYVKR